MMCDAGIIYAHSALDNQKGARNSCAQTWQVFMTCHQTLRVSQTLRVYQHAHIQGYPFTLIPHQ